MIAKNSHEQLSHHEGQKKCLLKTTPPSITYVFTQAYTTTVVLFGKHFGTSMSASLVLHAAGFAEPL